jgi:hypothetical protein
MSQNVSQAKPSMMQWFVFFASSFEQMSAQPSLAQVHPSHDIGQNDNAII